MGQLQSGTRFLYYLFGFEKINTPKRWTLVVGTHLVAWVLFFCLPLLFFPIRIADNNFFIKEGINKIFLIGFFYLNYFFFVPKYFLRQKPITYFLLIIISIGVLLAQHVVTQRLFMPFPRNSPAEGQPVPGYPFGINTPTEQSSPPQPPMIRSQPFDPEKPPGPFGAPIGLFYASLGRVFSSTFMLILLGGFIHLSFSFIQSQNKNKVLENANLQAEINLLRSQIDPHFLFNTLNSIYSLAYIKAEQTSLSILKLSDILRYMIYEASSGKTSLERDLHYISNYIDLQRLRLSEKVTIHYSVTGNTRDFYIAPLLLITFIENAFKHGVSYAKASTICIDITVVNQKLHLMVCNPVVIDSRELCGGMGLRNARRRLDLLYPSQYKLYSRIENEIFIVNLKINLNGGQLHDH